MIEQIKKLNGLLQVILDIVTLAKKYPNDMEFGKSVRKYLSDNKL